MHCMSSVPRDPSHYFPSEHAVVRKKERNVEWDDVSRAIERGRQHAYNDDDCCVFIYKEDNKRIYVPANVETGEIITIHIQGD